MRLELRDLRFRYPGTDIDVLDGVHLAVPAGRVVGLQAPSGTGKSTLLRLCATLLPPDSGDVLIDAEPVTATGYATPVAVRRKIGMIFQSPRTSTDTRLTLRKIIAAPLSFRDGLRRPHPDRYTARLAELGDLVQLTEDLLDRLPHQVSDGQLQRACLARALALDPVLLLCDEPTAMLDAPTTAVIMRVVADRVSQGASAVIASHDADLLDVTCSTVHPLESLSADRAQTPTRRSA